MKIVNMTITITCKTIDFDLSFTDADKLIGHEVVGEVVAIGKGTHEVMAKRLLNKKVVGSFIMPCLSCAACDRGEEEMCYNFFEHNRKSGHLYDGKTRLFRGNDENRNTVKEPVAMYSMGGLAEYCVTPISSVSPIPMSLLDDAKNNGDDRTINNLSIVGCAIFTAYGAVHNTAKLRKGESCCIMGVGGIGSSIIQIAKAAGASTIIAVDISDDKLSLAAKLGATHFINANGKQMDKVNEEIKEIFANGHAVGASGGVNGVDVCFEALGRGNTVNAAINAVRDGGRAVIIGLSHPEDFGSFQITHIVRRQIKIFGSYGARATSDLPAIMKLIAEGELDVNSTISRRFSLDNVDDAYKLLQRGEIVGRAIIEMNS